MNKIAHIFSGNHCKFEMSMHHGNWHLLVTHAVPSLKLMQIFTQLLAYVQQYCEVSQNTMDCHVAIWCRYCMRSFNDSIQWAMTPGHHHARKPDILFQWCHRNIMASQTADNSTVSSTGCSVASNLMCDEGRVCHHALHSNHWHSFRLILSIIGVKSSMTIVN